MGLFGTSGLSLFKLYLPDNLTLHFLDIFPSPVALSLVGPTFLRGKKDLVWGQ